MVVDMEAKEERKEEGQGQEQEQGQGEEGVKPEELKPKLHDKLVKGLEELVRKERTNPLFFFFFLFGFHVRCS